MLVDSFVHSVRKSSKKGKNLVKVVEIKIIQ